MSLEEQRLKGVIHIKDELIKHMTVLPHTDRYCITISQEEWHKLFETERCKEFGLIK